MTASIVMQPQAKECSSHRSLQMSEAGATSPYVWPLGSTNLVDTLALFVYILYLLLSLLR